MIELAENQKVECRSGMQTSAKPDLIRRRLMTGMGSLALAGLTPALPGFMPFASANAATAEDLSITKNALMADGVYGCRGADDLMTEENHGAIANLGFIIGKDGVAIIDSGGSLLHAKALLDEIEAITPLPIRYVINTHMHPDHIFGNALFRDKGAQFVGHYKLPRALDARGDYYLESYRRQIGDELMKGVEIISPTILVEDTTILDLGDRQIELRAWQAAHTDNDLTVRDLQSDVLFTGDLLFLGTLPTIDGSLLGWMKQMDELSAIPAKGIVPGHGPLDATSPEAFEPESTYFNVLAADLRAAIKDGVPLAKAVQTAAASERGKWKLFDEYSQRNATAAYAELEWE